MKARHKSIADRRSPIADFSQPPASVTRFINCELEIGNWKLH
jgi:hypothetical protein